MIKKFLVGTICIMTAVFTLLNCETKPPIDPGDASSGWICTVDAGDTPPYPGTGVSYPCPDCSIVIQSLGEPGTTPADLCVNSCAALNWNLINRCVYGGDAIGGWSVITPQCNEECKDSPTLQAAYRSGACNTCLATKCVKEWNRCETNDTSTP